MKDENLLTPDEEANLLNHLVGLADQFKVTKRLPSDWNRKALDRQVKQLDHDLDKFFKRLQRIGDKKKKAS